MVGKPDKHWLRCDLYNVLRFALLQKLPDPLKIRNGNHVRAKPDYSITQESGLIVFFEVLLVGRASGMAAIDI